MRRTDGRVDPDEDDLTVRDRRYESFGEQGVALATYAVPGHEETADHAADGWGRGVDRVGLGDDLGELAPPSSVSPDVGASDQVQDRVRARLGADPALDDRDLDVIVHHGQVTLGGTVSDDEQRRRAVVDAAAVRGVVDVVDRIRIQKPR
jgi:osmotically-inducible protein OsmY